MKSLFLTPSLFFCAFLTLPAHAAYLPGKKADVVLGQSLPFDRKLGLIAGLAADPATGKLFVSLANRSCIMRFSSQAALENGAAAEAILGQLDFASFTSSTGPAGLNAPAGLACDKEGRLWVADKGNNRVLRFDKAATLASGASANGVLGQSEYTTVTAATTAAKMDSPSGVAVDASGRLWVTDTNNSRVLWFNSAAARPAGALANGVIGQTNFTGSTPWFGAAGMPAPCGVAVEGGYHGVPITLWVSDTSADRVVRFDDAATLPQTGAVADGVLGQPDFDTYDNSPSLGMLSPKALAVDGDGRLWVADEGYHRVLKFNNARYKPSGNLMNTADGVLGQADLSGTGTGPYAWNLRQPAAIAVWGDQLWIGNHGDARVLRYADGGSLPTQAAADSVLGKASLEPATFEGLYTAGVAVCPLSGKLFVSEPDKNRVVRFPDSSALQSGAQPEAVLGQADLYSSLPGTAPMLMRMPRDLTVDAAGRLWVCDTENNRVVRFDNAANASSGASASGVLGQAGYLTSETGATAFRMAKPQGIAADAAGNVWVSDRGNNRVVRFANAATLPTVNPQAVQVLGQMAFGTSAGGLSATQLNTPAGLAMQGTRLWIADQGNNRVLRFDNAATLGNGFGATAVLGQPNPNTSVPVLSASGMWAPVAVACGSNDRLWVALAGQNRILRFEFASTKGTGAPANGVIGQPDLVSKVIGYDFQFTPGPNRIAVGPGERLWVSDVSAGRVAAFSPECTAVIKEISRNQNGLFTVKASTVPGEYYQLQRSSDLQTWTVVAGTMLSINNELTWGWGGPPQARQFFRIVEP